MKARRFIRTERRRIEVQDFEISPPGRGEVLVENEVTAVSPGTETWNYVHGAEPGRDPSFPIGSGYCGAGTVIEVGEGVEGLQIGDRVATQGFHASHQCMDSHLTPIPDATTWEDAVFLVMTGIAIRGVRRGEVQLGANVAVLGMGLVGQLAMSLSRLAGGSPLIALDLHDGRLQTAKQRGADVIIAPKDIDDTAKQIRAFCESDGADVVIEATGNPAVYPMATAICRNGGKVVALGSPRGSVEMDFMRDVHLREVDIIGAFQPRTPDRQSPYYPWSRERDRRLLLKMMADGRLIVADLITHRCQPEQCQEIYEMLAERPLESIGVVFQWR
ncbi:MAG: zinc-binding alcohol dehydrogenase [Candidatus Latescibacterota bacterium]|nr:zinc-binding alcohol dehydrogenase [Candidatus Latescibacterota bacterium]